MVPADARDAGEQFMNDPVMGIEPQMGDDPLGGRARIVTEESEDADPEGERHRAADQLEGADYLESEVSGLRRFIHPRHL